MQGTHVAVHPADGTLGSLLMDKKFAGKIAVITGASTGIGLATARAWSQGPPIRLRSLP